VEDAPGVLAASLADCDPLGNPHRQRHLRARLQSRATNAQVALGDRHCAGVFTTMGIALLGGRDFGARMAGAPKVAVINETFARHYFAANPSARVGLVPTNTMWKSWA